MQPSFPTTHVSGTVVEARTRKTCAGVPTRITNVDHGPSLPSLQNVRIQISEVGQAANIPGLTRLDNDGLRHGKFESTMDQTYEQATLSREIKPRAGICGELIVSKGAGSRQLLVLPVLACG